MKHCHATQTIWDEQFEHDGRTYSVDALLDSTWTKQGIDGDMNVSLEDFELVSIELRLRNADTDEYVSARLYENMSFVPEPLRPYLMEICMKKLEETKLDSWDEV